MIFGAALLFIAGFMSTTTAVLGQGAVSTASERCGLTQNYLKNIVKNRDLYARVDRLQAYQYIYHRLDVFVRRLERNNQAGASEMRMSLNKFNTQIESFKSNYEQYDSSREALISVTNCRKNLAQFQDKLAEARIKRSAVHQDVLDIKATLETELIEQLNTILATLKTESEPSNE